VLCIGLTNRNDRFVWLNDDMQRIVSDLIADDPRDHPQRAAHFDHMCPGLQVGANKRRLCTLVASARDEIANSGVDRRGDRDFDSMQFEFCASSPTGKCQISKLSKRP